MAKLSIKKEINSAHGKKIHGHTFQFEINFECKIENNMVGNLDFNTIEPEIDKVLAKLDKVYLDDIIKPRATIENIAIYVIKELSNIKELSSVKVWEGNNKNVEIRKGEIL